MDVKICKICDGTGETREDIGTHNSEYVFHKCSGCNGTGRVYTRSYSYTVPYNMKKQIIYDFDSVIIDLIRKLESLKHEV